MTQLSLRVPTLSGAAIARSLPGLVELLAVAGVIVLLLPLFARLAALGTGRDQRFDALGFVVRGLPAPVLPAVCRSHGALAEPALQGRLCGRISPSNSAAALDELPPVLKKTLLAADHAFLEPVLQAEAQLVPLRLQQREGIGDLRALSDQIAGLEADTRPFAEHFQLIQTEEARGPAPLICATRAVEAVLQQPDPAAAGDGSARIARANLVLLLAAAFDGHAATEALSNQALLPSAAARSPPSCGATHDLSAALSAASSLMADARLSTLNLRKNDAVQALLQTAGWQWAGRPILRGRRAYPGRRSTVMPHARPDANSSSASTSSAQPRKCFAGSSSVEPYTARRSGSRRLGSSRSPRSSASRRASAASATGPSS